LLAVLFIEFWKRKTATLAYEWQTSDFEELEEQPRAEFLIKSSNNKNSEESISRTRLKMFAGISTIIFMVMI